MTHNSVASLRIMPPIRRTLSAILIGFSLVLGIAASGALQGTSFTYQGQLRRSGAAYNGTCNFQFDIWNAVSGGAQQATTQSINSVKVVNGLFTVVLDFGNQFGGAARWLGTSVQCSGDAAFTPLDPRQPITATPYALSLRPGATIHNESGDSALGLITSGPGDAPALGVFGSGTRDAISGYSTKGSGVYGNSTSTTPGSSAGVFGINASGGDAGRFEGPVGVYGRLSVAGPITADISSQGNGTAISGSGVTTGVFGQGGVGVSGTSASSSGYGVYGTATGTNAAGVFGENSSGPGIWGKSTGAGSAVYGQATSTGLAGRFTGSVVVEGNLIVQGSVSKPAGSFRIDHPLDPANKFLSHSFVESPDMKNIYDGNVTTDATGSATVRLPDYFAALNRDFRYQLTALGQFAQAIVSREIVGNSFEIHTDKPGVKVSWQVTGIRQDAYAQAKPIVVEEFKPAEEKGLYLYPAGFGAGEEKQIGYSSRPAVKPGAQEAPASPRIRR